MIERRGFLTLVAFSALAAACMMHPASAQNWPARPMTMVVPFGVGSGSDLIARILGARMAEILGQPVIIENISGAGGMTAAARVASSPPDGYQFVLGSVDTFAINQTLYKKPLYNAATDFIPIGLVTDQPMVLIARNDFPANNMQEFAAYAKANHAKMTFASGGVGSGSHLTCARMNAAMGVDVTHVTYRGSAQAMQDLFAGRIDYYCSLAAAAVGPIESKSAKAIAILTRDRSPLFPGLASAHEQGLTDFHANFWTGLFLPKNTPELVVQKLNQASIETLNTPSVQERLLKIGVSVIPTDQRSSAYSKSFVESQIKVWEAVIKASGVQTLD
jgi:tripartite-type tricarboxylate transporter receptor subunit TctC